MSGTTNRQTTPQTQEMAEPTPTPYPRIELETTVVYEGFTFRTLFRDVSLTEAVAALTRRGCTPVVRVDPTATAAHT